MAEGGDTPTFRDGSFDDNLEEQNDEGEDRIGNGSLMDPFPGELCPTSYVLALKSIYEGGDMERLKVLSSPSEEKEGLYTLHLTIPAKTEGQDIQVDILMPAKSDTASAGPGPAPPEVGKGVNFMRSNSGQRWVGSFSVKYLPPLSLQVVLPPTYPSQGAPVFTLSCVWLTANQLSSLCDQLDKLWLETENLPVVFTWVDWLENNVMSHLAIEDHVLLMPVQDEQNTLEEQNTLDYRALPDCIDMGQAVSNMLQFNKFQLDVEFCHSNHECHVCYEELPGNQFFRLNDCEHHFCRDCMTAYCEHHVSIGTVENLRCPDTECDSIIPPYIVQSVLPADEFDRWERLLLQKTLESMTDMDWCPRCNNPVIREMEEELNLGHCTTCYFSFCTACRDPWHQGEVCQSMEDKLQQAEKRAPPKNEAERKKFEALRQKMLQEIETRKEMTLKNRICPKCKATIEKTGGCNKMTCRCGQSFCWVCRKAIDGYNHFYGSSGCSLSEGVQTRVLLPPPKETPDAVLWMEATIAVDPQARQRIIKCPTCRQQNLKENRNNHIKCWGCKSNFCFLCKNKIVGTVSSHFTTGLCTQHS